MPGRGTYMKRHNKYRVGHLTQTVLGVRAYNSEEKNDLCEVLPFWRLDFIARNQSLP
jgi:hypothetical protein